MSKELFLKALNTLFFSGGGDPCSEQYWAANEFLDYFEDVNNIKLGIRFNMGSKENNWEPNFEEVFNKITECE